MTGAAAEPGAAAEAEAGVARWPVAWAVPVLPAAGSLPVRDGHNVSSVNEQADSRHTAPVSNAAMPRKAITPFCL
ncbi:MAG: hypothetical protein A3B62_06125 [Rhodospirillales bacterium RIFCSPLOWO2_01_FULL_65_14]|nr:MAG: hypothetical protein A3B62_06125 [Rhodospirillales bacterium RIFCSPLOWO2_01_FULL_65_14]